MISSRTASAMIVFENKILLLLRDDIPEIPFPNQWATIGGYIEEGETSEQGCLREIKEEAGLLLDNVIYIGERQKPNNQKGYYYFAKIDKNKAETIQLGDEGQKLRFFAFDELSGLKLAGTFGKLFAEYPQIIEEMLSKEVAPKPEDLELSQ